MRVEGGKERCNKVVKTIEYGEHDHECHCSHHNSHNTYSGDNVYGVGALFCKEVSLCYGKR